MTKKKILFVLPHLNGGGAERVTINYIKSLDSHLFKPVLVVFDETKDLFPLIPRDLQLINTNTINVSKSLFKLITILKEHKPEYVFTSHYRISTLIYFSSIATGKFIHIARIPGSPKSEKENNYYGTIRRWLFAIGLRSADKIIAQTFEMKEEAVEIFNLSSNKCFVLPNPLDKEYINDAKNADTGLFPKNEFSIIAAGRLHDVKGYNYLITAMSQVLKNQPNAHLHIIGSDKGAKKKLEELVIHLNLAEKVTLHGFIKNPYPYYKECDLFVLSSLHEGFPNALLENYYLNTPIVSTRCAKIVENLIVEKSNGFLVSAKNSDELAKKILLATQMRRGKINNLEYKGSTLDQLLR